MLTGVAVSEGLLMQILALIAFICIILDLKTLVPIWKFTGLTAMCCQVWGYHSYHLQVLLSDKAKLVVEATQLQC